jgi:hypothetical protein
LYVVAGLIVAAAWSPASAQLIGPSPNMPTGMDCGNPQNALEYYCNHRNEFDSAGHWQGAAPVAAAPTATGAVTTHTPARHRVAHRTMHTHS